MFHSTTAENFRSWDRFLDAYYEPIRTALRLIPSVGEDQADDLAQSFFLKMYERDILQKPPAITGRFRNWLYAAARHHAVDEWRRMQRRPSAPALSKRLSRSTRIQAARMMPSSMRMSSTP